MNNYFKKCKFSSLSSLSILGFLPFFPIPPSMGVDSFVHSCPLIPEVQLSLSGLLFSTAKTFICAPALSDAGSRPREPYDDGGAILFIVSLRQSSLA